MKQIFSIDQIELTHQFIVIQDVVNFIHHESDQRSRDFPGHGYGAHTEEVKSFKFFAFTDKEDLEDWITKNHLNLSAYKIIAFQPVIATIKTVVSVSLASLPR